jgi:hypothetical protein
VIRADAWRVLQRCSRRLSRSLDVSVRLAEERTNYLGGYFFIELFCAVFLVLVALGNKVLLGDLRRFRV